MSYQLSDDESTDSESGIRFKTESTRKIENTSYVDKSVILGFNNSKYDKNSSSNSSQYSDKGYYNKNKTYSYDRRSNSHDRHRRSNSYDRYRRSQSPELRHSSEYKYRKHKHKLHKKDKEYEHHKHRKHKSNYELKKRSSSSENDLSNEINLDDNSSDSDKPSINKNPDYKRRKESVSDDEKPSTSRNHDNIYGPTLPPTKSKSDDSESDKYGPTLPPITTKKIEVENTAGVALPPKKNEIENTQDIEMYVGPALPSRFESNRKSPEEESCIGPALPPSFIKNDSTNRKSQENDSYIGPALPSEVIKNETTDPESLENDSYIGPALPPSFQKKSNTIGPTIPDHLRKKLENTVTPINDDSDDDVIGPLPEGHSSSGLSHKLLEERALEMKISKLTPSGPELPVREEWMLELPEVHASNLGLGPRQFRKNIGPDMSDRSSWTETPQDKEKKRTNKPNTSKVDIKKQCELDHLAKRDEEQAKIVEKHKKKRKKDKSLVDIHRDKMKKKEDPESKTERRPFDRDIDLKVNRFDEAQKKAIFKKAQLLDTRFSSGESKFL